jgi:thiol-disulfide isomerase/thioredoxin
MNISLLKELPSNYFIFGGIAIIVCVISYFVWNNYISSKINHDSNREHNEQEKNSNKVANLMLFYVDWCPHCKTAKPEWNELKEQYDGQNINGYTIVFEEYNCTEESSEIEELVNKFNIDGYPTIKLIKDNQVIEYDAKPTKSTMEQFLMTVL